MHNSEDYLKKNHNFNLFTVDSKNVVKKMLKNVCLITKNNFKVMINLKREKN